MAHNINWGVVATRSARLGGVPFSNANAFIAINGSLFFYVTAMDTSMQDVAADPHVSFTITEASKPGMCANLPNSSLPDPEDPTCARLTFTGVMRAVEASQVAEVRSAMFARHPQMASWPDAHHWFFTTIELTSDLWLIDYYGGAAMISPSEYYAAAVPKGVSTPSEGRRHDERWTMGPPPGPTDAAYCPVTGAALRLGPSTPAVDLVNGQRLYFASAAAAAGFRRTPRDFWLAPHDLPLPGADGMRGLPDLRNQTLRCPRSNESIVVAMPTPRVVMRHGQAVYFCCHGCVTAFWESPGKYIL